MSWKQVMVGKNSNLDIKNIKSWESINFSVNIAHHAIKSGKQFLVVGP